MHAVLFTETQDLEEIKDFKIGLRYEPLQAKTSILDRGSTEESSIRTKHWVIVFTPRMTATHSYRMELLPRSDKNLGFVFTRVESELNDTHPIGQWTGCLQDLKTLMETHPMNNVSSNYSPVYNNCQHWAAAFLVHLEALERQNPTTSLLIVHRERYNKVLSILGKAGTGHLYNKSNRIFRGMQAGTMALGGGTVGVLGVASTATVATTVAVELPAAGILGLFGATTTTLIPVGTAATAGAMACAIALPAVLAGVAVGGIIFAVQSTEWKDKTRFRDPRIPV
ncbi:hypothetical protein SLS60_011045 [Paraconiothyrium brasiliense]|uniref:LRAT domain-containing protein n=1 Tax=Paraconiothyrium brasiliense TaxID=300254 RepID=A0ABR3QKE8_9PLEO